MLVDDVAEIHIDRLSIPDQNPIFVIKHTSTTLERKHQNTKIIYGCMGRSYNKRRLWGGAALHQMNAWKYYVINTDAIKLYKNGGDES